MKEFRAEKRLCPKLFTIEAKRESLVDKADILSEAPWLSQTPLRRMDELLIAVVGDVLTCGSPLICVTWL